MVLAAAPLTLAAAPLYWPIYRRLSAAGLRLPRGGFAGYLAALAASLASSLATMCLLSADSGAPPPGPVEAEAWPAIAASRREGKGVILASPHLGDVVLLVSVVAARGLPVTLVMPQAESYRWLEFPGFRLAPLGTGASDCLAALARNEAVLLLCDRDHFPGNRTAPFFGAPVSPPHGAARLAAAAGAPVLPVACLREGAGHRLVGEKVIAPRSPEAVESGILAAFERLIARAPAQWLIFVDPWAAARRGAAA